MRLEASAEDRSAVVLLELTASPRDLAPIRTGAGELLRGDPKIQRACGAVSPLTSQASTSPRRVM